jgi:hypothetical protein
MTGSLRAAAVAAALTVFSVASGFGQQEVRPMPVFGLGDKTCADWTAASQRGDAEFHAMQAWILGYVSGAVMADYNRTQLPMPPMELVRVPTPSYLSAGTISVETRPWTAAGLLQQVNSRCPYDARESLNNVASDLARQLTPRQFGTAPTSR